MDIFDLAEESYAEFKQEMFMINLESCLILEDYNYYNEEEKEGAFKFIKRKLGEILQGILSWFQNIWKKIVAKFKGDKNVEAADKKISKNVNDIKNTVNNANPGNAEAAFEQVKQTVEETREMGQETIQKVKQYRVKADKKGNKPMVGNMNVQNATEVDEGFKPKVIKVSSSLTDRNTIKFYVHVKVGQDKMKSVTIEIKGLTNMSLNDPNIGKEVANQLNSQLDEFGKYKARVAAQMLPKMIKYVKLQFKILKKHGGDEGKTIAKNLKKDFKDNGINL